MFKQADEMEKDLTFRVDPSGYANLEVLRRVRPRVTDGMWMQLGGHGGGLFALPVLSAPNDANAQRRLEDYRRLFEDALANRVTPGMEADVQIEWSDDQVN